MPDATNIVTSSSAITETPEIDLLTTFSTTKKTATTSMPTARPMTTSTSLTNLPQTTTVSKTTLRSTSSKSTKDMNMPPSVTAQATHTSSVFPTTQSSTAVPVSTTISTTSTISTTTTSITTGTSITSTSNVGISTTNEHVQPNHVPVPYEQGVEDDYPSIGFIKSHPEVVTAANTTGIICFLTHLY